MSQTSQNGKPKTYCTSINITPRVDSQSNKSTKSIPNVNEQVGAPFRNTSDSLLVASVDGKAVGSGPGVIYSAINGNPNLGPTANGPKVNASDPQVRKLVYNMYRGLLNTKHERANNIVESAPEEYVTTDEGVGERVVSMMRHQSDQREGKMMNLGPPPPPPPPPFSTGAPAPAPKPPVEVPSKAPPPVAIPAALAGAMLKEKKPFTYTPGGLNLAEINAQPPAQQNGIPFIVQHTGSHDPVQSRSFKVLQNAYSQEDPSGPQIEVSSEPRKYAGSHIPSRSFRMLQTMTDDVPSDDSSSFQEKLRRNESIERREDPNSSSNISNSLKTLSSSIHSPISPSSSLASVASDCEIGSRVAPSYTNTSDSYVYRHVSPKIISNSSSTERVVNSALCARRDSPSKIWLKDCPTNSLQSCGSQHSIESPEYVNSPPRLLNIIKQENSASGSESVDNKRLYEGGNIPSRAFKQLQNDYSNRNVSNSSPVLNANTSSSNHVTEVYVPRVMQQLRLDQRNPSSESVNSLDDHIRNGVLDTAYAKESVLKELTSQFDPQTSLKKPKAAPGKVFRYLQQQYDDPQDSDFVSMTSSSTSFSNNDSPSFSSVSSGIDSTHSEIEPKPYSGCRIPGRTFRLLQENIDTHPTVLQARK